MKFLESSFADFFRRSFRRLITQPSTETFQVRLLSPVLVPECPGARVGQIVEVSARGARLLLMDKAGQLEPGQPSPFEVETLVLK
jgi:hypothetical protein